MAISTYIENPVTMLSYFKNYDTVRINLFARGVCGIKITHTTSFLMKDVSEVLKCCHPFSTPSTIFFIQCVAIPLATFHFPPFSSTPQSHF